MTSPAAGGKGTGTTQTKEVDLVANITYFLLFRRFDAQSTKSDEK